VRKLAKNPNAEGAEKLGPVLRVCPERSCWIA
jgi:hypothetical protein